MKELLIGYEEWCALPLLGLGAIKAKVDSGASTSALHAVNISAFTKNNCKYVKFDVHPIQGNRKIVKKCVAPLLGKRVVRSSNGISERRHVIMTRIQLGTCAWDAEITLTNRDSMGYRMLLGKEAMREIILIDPNRSCLTKEISQSASLRHYAKYTNKKHSLNIVLLASNPDLYSNRRIMEAGEKRGHNMTFINISSCYITVESGRHAIYMNNGKLLSDIDAVIPRLRPSITFYGCALLKQFRALGAFCLNDALAIANSRDKLRSLQILADSGIDMPLTSFANSSINTENLIKAVGGAPIVIKLLESTQGMGVMLAETHSTALSVINAFKSVKANILVQEFIKEANGCDIRCFVIDNEMVASMSRKAALNDFRSNLHLGGSASKIQLTQLEIDIAIQAVQSLSLKVAGVDIMRAHSGPKVIEVNSSPGLEGIEHISEIDVADLIIRCIEKYVIPLHDQYIPVLKKQLSNRI